MNVASRFIVAACVLVVPLSTASAWVYTKSGDLEIFPQLIDAGYGVAVDPNGNVVAAGLLSYPGVGRDLAIVKLSSGTGTEMWSPVLYNGSGSSADEANIVAVDAAGNIVVAGTSVPASGGGTDAIIMKVRGSDGQPSWTSPYFFCTGTGNDKIDLRRSSIALDASGNVFAAARAGNLTTSCNGSVINNGFVVLRVNGSNGAMTWERSIAGTAPSVNDMARGVALDGAGNVYAVGQISYTDTGPDFVVVKLSAATGMPAWTYRMNVPGGGTGVDGAYAVSPAPGGGVFAVGLTTIASGRQLTAVRISASGGEIWKRSLSSGLAEESLIARIPVDAAGDVAVAAIVEPSDELTVYKLSGTTGDPLWPAPGQLNNTFLGIRELDRDVIFDHAGNVVMLGATADPFLQVARSTIGLVKFRGTDGAQIFLTEPWGDNSLPPVPPDPLPIETNLGFGLAVDDYNDIFLTGWFWHAATGLDFAVLKATACTGQTGFHNGPPGILGLCGDGFSDEGEQCDDGNTISNDNCNNHCRVTCLGDISPNNGEVTVLELIKGVNQNYFSTDYKFFGFDADDDCDISESELTLAIIYAIIGCG